MISSLSGSQCDYCEGAGWVKSPITVCYEILVEARRLAKHIEDVRQTTLRIHPDVAKALRTSESEVFDEIEAHLGNIDLTVDPHIHQANSISRLFRNIYKDEKN